MAKRLGTVASAVQFLSVASVLALQAVFTPVSAESTIRPGWGFNWRLKERATCRLIDNAVLPSCSRCREAPNAYQSGINAQVCYLVPRFEYVIFPTEADCQTGLDLMKKGAR